jgi:hypothetical protein
MEKPRGILPLMSILLLASTFAAAGQPNTASQIMPRPCNVQIIIPSNGSQTEIVDHVAGRVENYVRPNRQQWVWVVVHPIIRSVDRAIIEDFYWVQFPAELKADGSWDTDYHVRFGMPGGLRQQKFEVKAFLNPTAVIPDDSRNPIKMGTQLHRWPHATCESPTVTVVRRD